MTNIVFYFALMAVFIAEAAVLCRVLPLQRLLAAEDRAGGRLLTVDGLRGVLAPSVFLHHAVLYFYFTQTRGWSEMPSNFYAQMGVLPVTLFFFVTGYLFWSKLMKRPMLGFGAFLKDRLGRLGGVYFVSCLLFFGLVAVASGFHRQVSWGRLVFEAAAWFSFLGAGHDMNGVFDSKRLLGQVWTLREEWMFYLSLPFLGWFARRRVRLPVLLVGAAVFSVLVAHVTLRFSAPTDYVWKMLGDYAHFLFVTFSVGMIVAATPVTEQMKAWARGSTATLISVVLLAITVAVVPPEYGWLESSMLAVPFACVCFGNTWWGLLASAPVRSLGRVSYSFYLLHIFALQAGLEVLQRFVAVGSLTPMQYWVFMTVCGMVGVLASYASYQFLEHPFLKKAVRHKAETMSQQQQPQILQAPLVS
ncbi:acyltransferase family protein [Granulicella arctica]|uniref:Peptidoglycan/LPS O-acetylase OafA/YrhL n=1 Tax=Granulicella arctica TaxID=940613 RepID=A0A7Y9PHC2_9BACT|nr:peptidoglycan/LPS O-acetylase OafA/YrhL [Granulicella arctica]